MAVNTEIQVPFIPQNGITQQILSAIQLANESHARNQQLAQQQQQLQLNQLAAPGERAKTEAQTGLFGAQTQEAQTNQQMAQAGLQMRQREMEYVFGSPQNQGQAGPVEQKSGLMSDLQDTKKRLNLNDEESAQFDQAMRSVQAGFLSKGQLDMSPVDKVIQDHMALQNKKDTELHPTYRQQDGQWYQDMHTAEGKLAYSVPTPPPAEYLAHSTEGVDYMRTVDAQTGQVTITPIGTSKVTQPIMPGQSKPSVPLPTPPTVNGGQPVQLQGGGKKLSEAGQSMITGLTNATSLTQPAIDFLSKTPPSNVDWYSGVAKYKLHMDPGPELAQVFQAIGMARAIATGPLLHGIRNQDIIKGIQEHLPDITDTPALALQKMKDLQPFWKKAMDEVYKTENVKQSNSSGEQAAPAAAAPKDEFGPYGGRGF